MADRDHVLRLQLVGQKEWVLACTSSGMLSKWSDTLQEQLGERGRGEVSTGLRVLVETCADSPYSPAAPACPDSAADDPPPWRKHKAKCHIRYLLCSRVAAPPLVMQPHPAHLVCRVGL